MSDMSNTIKASNAASGASSIRQETTARMPNISNWTPHIISLGTRSTALVSKMAGMVAKSVQTVDETWRDWGTKLYPTPGGYSYIDLLNVVLNNAVLFMGCCLRAEMATNSGFFVENAVGKRENKRKNASFLYEWGNDHLKWRAGGGIGGLITVIQQMLKDYHMFGCGFLECLPPEVAPAEQRDITRFRTVGVAHLPRLQVRLLKPEKSAIKVGNKDVYKYDPRDLLFPRLAYCGGGLSTASVPYGDIVYLKAYGDTRKINMYTGAVDPKCTYDQEATEFVRLRNYVPGYEEGWPSWLSALQQVDVVDALAEYFRHILRNNAVPDLMVVLKGASIDEEYVRKMENKFRALRQRRKELDNHVNVIVWSLVQDSPEDAESAPDVSMEWERLNPIDGNVVHSLLDVQKQSELQLGMALRIPSQIMNYERNTGLGSGAEITAAMHVLNKLVIGPDQGLAHSLIDRIVREGLGISDVRIRLEMPSYNDPETEARIAKMWSSVKGMMLKEWRDKIGLTDLREVQESDESDGGIDDIGNVMVIPAADVALSLRDLRKIIEGVYKTEGDGGLSEGDLRDQLKAMFEEWMPELSGGVNNEEDGKKALKFMEEVYETVGAARKEHAANGNGADGAAK